MDRTAEPWQLAWAKPKPSARIALACDTVQVTPAVRLIQPMTSALLDIAASRAGYFKRAGGTILSEDVTARFKMHLSRGAAARSQGGPIMLHGVNLGSDQTNEGPPLSRISLLLMRMLPNSTLVKLDKCLAA